LGIILAGIWTWLLFVRQRLAFPKLDIDLVITDAIVLDEARFIHAQLSLKNVGSVVLTSNRAELRIRQIAPLPDELKPGIKEGYDPVGNDRTEVEWPMIAGREWKWNRGDFEIEPGEKDSLQADFVISTAIQVVEFYSFVGNAKKKRQGIGWTLTRIHEFQIMEDNGMAVKKDKSVKRVTGDQQRQQKQQKPQQQTQPKKEKSKKS
jgi:hypothetical protein